jgi:hypothetical protein
MGLIGEEITVTATVRSVEEGVALVDSEARQAGKRLIRNGAAEVRVD